MFRNSSPNPFFWQSLGNFNLFYLTLCPYNILGNPQIDKNQLKQEFNSWTYRHMVRHGATACLIQSGLPVHQKEVKNKMSQISVAHCIFWIT